MSSTPQATSFTAVNSSSFRKQPISWADMEDDGEEWDFDFPVQTLKVGEMSPSTATNASDEITPDRNAADVEFHTVAAKATAATEVSTTRKRPIGKAVAKADEVSPSRMLLPDFAEIVVDNVIPYQFKSTAAAPAGNDSTTSDFACGPLLQTYDILQALSETAATGSSTSKSEKKAKAEGQRRAKAVRTLQDALAEFTGPVACDDLSRHVNWNRKFRPALGCLFTFLKKHRDTFTYSKGLVGIVGAGGVAAQNSSILSTATTPAPESRSYSAVF